MKKQKNRHRLNEYAGAVSYQHEKKSKKEYRRFTSIIREFGGSSSTKA